MIQHIDGGGVRSYSSILIIRALMDQVRSLSENGDDEQGELYRPLSRGVIIIIQSRRAHAEPAKAGRFV